MRLSYFQFLPLSDFLHLKSANIKIISSIFSFINSDLSISYYIINLPVFQSQSRNQLGKKRRRIFAFGEDSHALRLASELAELWAANANRRICCRCKCPAKPCHPSQNKGHPSDAPCFVSTGHFRCRFCVSQFRCTAKKHFSLDEAGACK